MSDFALRISRIKKTHIIRPEVEGIERPEAREALRGADTPSKGLGWAVGGLDVWRSVTCNSFSPRKVDTRLPGKGNSNSRGARPVYSFR
jgi:hypothetical protein